MLELRSLLSLLCRKPRIDRDIIPPRVLSPMLAAQSCELYSLEPRTRRPSGATFHGWEVLGHTPLKRDVTRKNFINALRIAANEQPGLAAGCFIPHHGLRFVGRDTTLDLVICFKCLSMNAYTDDGGREQVLLMDSPRQLFNDTLTRAGVRLGESAAG